MKRRTVPAAAEKPKGTWGGRRPGAGRKPKGDRALVPHRALPEHDRRRPVLVTLRAGSRELRKPAVMAAIGVAVRGANHWDPESFRVLRYVVGPEHVHLAVEADDKRTLSGGVRSVSIRIARSVNDALGRTGRFWADRWHGRALASKRELGRALAGALALGVKRRPRLRRAGR